VDTARPDAGAGVTALYRGHAVGLIRLAIIMLGDRAAAEDVGQDASPDDGPTGPSVTW